MTSEAKAWASRSGPAPAGSACLAPAVVAAISAALNVALKDLAITVMTMLPPGQTRYCELRPLLRDPGKHARHVGPPLLFSRFAMSASTSNFGRELRPTFVPPPSALLQAVVDRHRRPSSRP